MMALDFFLKILDECLLPFRAQVSLGVSNGKDIISSGIQRRLLQSIVYRTNLRYSVGALISALSAVRDSRGKA